MQLIVDLFCGAVGFALCWFLKDKILLMVHGAATFAQKLRAKAKALETAIKG